MFSYQTLTTFFRKCNFYTHKDVTSTFIPVESRGFKKREFYFRISEISPRYPFVKSRHMSFVSFLFYFRLFFFKRGVKKHVQDKINQKANPCQNSSDTKTCVKWKVYSRENIVGTIMKKLHRQVTNYNYLHPNIPFIIFLVKIPVEFPMIKTIFTQQRNTYSK